MYHYFSSFGGFCFWIFEFHFRGVRSPSSVLARRSSADDDDRSMGALLLLGRQILNFDLFFLNWRADFQKFQSSTTAQS